MIFNVILFFILLFIVVGLLEYGLK